MAKKAEGGDNLTNHPRREEIIKKLSIASKKVWDNPEYKLKHIVRFQGENNPRYGKEWSEESKEKSKLSHKIFYSLNDYKNKGKTNVEIHGEEKATEISKKLSNAAKLKIAELNPFYGKTHSNETKEILSKKMKGKKPTNRRKIKIGELIFESGSDAAKYLNVCSATIIHRINSPNEKYKDYSYL